MSFFFHLQPASLLLLSPPLCSADAAMEGQPGHLLLAEPPHALRPTSSTALYPLRWSLLAPPRAQKTTAGRHLAVAVASSLQSPRAYLLRALALQEPPRPVPLALSLFPRSDAPERRRHLLTVERIAPVLLRSTQPLQ